MKRLIATRADDGIKEMCELTHPVLKQDVKDVVGVRLHFIVLPSVNLNTGQNTKRYAN